MIAKTLRKNFSKIRVYIPHVAASGATLIAISADEIVMGEISRLSPSMLFA
jgi:ClpP class serine protease